MLFVRHLFSVCKYKSVVIFVGFLLVSLCLLPHRIAAGATSSTVNFQARLMNGSGSIVPDGNYNVEFKLYAASSSSGSSQGSCTGDSNCLWLETRTGVNLVTVSNGYLTVNLGSVAAFGSSINWDQDLWLSMNIGGTGSPVWDGEMTPRLKLTSVPYAFRAGQLARLAGGNTGVLEFAASFAQNSTITLPDPGASTATVCYQTSTSCGFLIGAGSAFIQGGNSFGAVNILGSSDNNNLQLNTNGVVRATLDTSNSIYFGNGVTASSPSNFSIRGTGSTTTAVAGGSITLQGGNATVGNANGGNVTISGGLPSGSGTTGLVVIGTPTFSTASSQNCGTNCTITQSSVDSSGAVIANATASSLVITLPDPTITTAGRIVYVTAANGSSDFTLSVNGGGTGNQIAMRQNTTATMIWNGSDWTAAGASSSTTLQAAYDNTLSSAGGAEIILNNTATSNGLTVRNGSVSPIIGGGLLEVQSSIGTNLFSVNNNISELAANGGAEDSSTFSVNWTSLGSSSISRNTTSGQFATGIAGVSIVSGTTSGNGVRQNLSSSPAVSTSYLISFTAMLASGSPAFTDLRVDYSPIGASSGTQCIAGQTIVSTGWTKITCEINTPATSVTNPDILIYQVAAPGSGRTFYIDNLSMTLADDAGGIPNNVQIGGGIYGGAPTLFTLDRSSAPPVSNGNTTYLGSMYYDTVTGRIQCYESDGWGACGSAPDNIITLTPEYTGAVLNGSGIGTMTADFCANQAGVLTVNTSFCASGVSRNYYRWTSPQASQQSYSIYVSYKLPNTFKSFSDANTIKLTALTDNITNGTVDYQVFRSTGSAVTSCGSQTTVTTPNTNTWYQVPFSGDETACGFAGGNYIIFKINVRAQSNASVYVENLDFTYINT